MLSIVIPTHNRTDLLRACLQAATRHAPADCEIIVVDDASPDGAASQVAASFNVRSIRLKRQRGFAVAANTGIRASRGDFIEMLNDDTEVQPGWADAALPWFDDPNIGAVAPLVLAWPDGKTIDSAGDRYYLGGIAAKRGHGLPSPLRGRGAGGEGVDFLQPTRVFGASAAAGFYRKSALDRVGLFPEEFGSYFEDVDLAFRLNRAGYRTMFEPAARVLHHISASYGPSSPFAPRKGALSRSERRPSRQLIERQSCNEERVFWRNLPPPWLWRALPKHAAVLLGKTWLRLEEGTILPWLFGRLRVAWECRAIIRQRGEWSSNEDVAAWNVDDVFL